MRRTRLNWCICLSQMLKLCFSGRSMGWETNVCRVTSANSLIGLTAGTVKHLSLSTYYALASEKAILLFLSFVSNHIINLIRNKNPDVIFFIEQWYPVFSLIEEHLNSKEQNSYVFCYPQGFNPSFFKDGTYPSYAGVVAAFKNSIFSSVSCKDGTLWIKENPQNGFHWKLTAKNI